MTYRHGDILLVPTNKVAGKKVSKGKGYVLAEGETTGHKHLLTAQEKDASFVVCEDAHGNITIQLGVVGTLTHEEHKKLDIAPGTYKIVHEREKDWFALSVRRVVD